MSDELDEQMNQPGMIDMRGMTGAQQDDALVRAHMDSTEIDTQPIRKQLEQAVSQVTALGVIPNSLPVRQSISIAGTWRVYFNRAQAAPLVWCVALVDESKHISFEIAVAEVVVSSTFGARTVYSPKHTPDDEDGKPSAWLEVDGVLRIDAGSSVARIG